MSFGIITVHGSAKDTPDPHYPSSRPITKISSRYATKVCDAVTPQAMQQQIKLKVRWREETRVFTRRHCQIPREPPGKCVHKSGSKETGIREDFQCSRACKTYKKIWIIAPRAAHFLSHPSTTQVLKGAERTAPFSFFFLALSARFSVQSPQ